MVGTIIFGVDVESPFEGSVGYSKWGVELYHQLEIPVTFYLTGAVIESNPKIWANLKNDSLVNLECHTYNHILLKTVCTKIPEWRKTESSGDFQIVKGANLEEIDTDLTKCVQIFTDVIGRPPKGLTGPWCYYRGLMDRPDILDIIAKKGIKYLRTFGRNECDAQPVPMEWQPFFYTSQGYSELLELLIHDYQDDFLYKDFTNPNNTETYIEHLKKITDYVVEHNLVWSCDTHDHNCGTKEGFNDKAWWIREWVMYAKDKGVKFISGEEYYNEKVKK